MVNYPPTPKAMGWVLRSVLIKDSGKTDIDSQIKAIEILNENLIH
jgi:hypothetical protein